MASKHFQAASLISKGIFDDLSSFRDLELRVSNLSEQNSKAQGDAFEIFVEAYLATQPLLQCDETWLVGDIPVDVRECLNLPSDTKGIDGVYRTALGEFVPYQVKFRSNRPALGFNEVAPFLGITEKAKDRLLITNCDSIAIDVQNRTGIRSLRGVDFDQLTKEDFKTIEEWLKKAPKKPSLIKPEPYQIEALENISKHLQDHDRGTVVMACGTGKTLVALWAVEQSKAKNILVLVPSLTLLQQTLEEWSRHNSWGKKFSYLCVCSDPSVDLKNDEIEIDSTDLPFRIDTDPEIVKGYLYRENDKIKIIFSTYQSSQVVSQATKDNFDFDFAVFDEAHKTTGVSSGKFALALSDANIKIKKRLFLTATPKHYDIRKRDIDGELKFVGMDDESLYGSRAHTLLFSDAVAKGIICPYKVIITLIDKKQIDDFSLQNGITVVDGDAVRSKWVASQLAVSSAIRHTNASKIITFHSRVRSAKEFASDEAHGVTKFIDGFDVFHVHGKQKSNERKDTITKFRHSKKSLITNARCLTEGVDVPAVDMVVFVDPRHSKIDIAQAVGRAMRKPRGGNKKVGYIVVPIYAGDADEFSIDAAIKDEAFDDVSLVLNSLLEQDNELVEIIRDLKEAKGRGDIFSLKQIEEKVEVIGPFVDLQSLASSIFLEIAERLGSSWDEFFGALCTFKKREKHCRVPQGWIEGKLNLGTWVAAQRLLLAKNRLLDLRKDRLDQIDFVWDPFEQAWEIGFTHLDSFLQREGHCLVPSNFIENSFALGTWVAWNRREAKKGALSRSRFDRLNDLNFVWDPKLDRWEAAFQSLQKYVQTERDCAVPKEYFVDGINLGGWVSEQRKAYKKGYLSADKKQRLDALGFIWNTLDHRWNFFFKELCKFKNEHKHCLVPDNYIQGGENLGVWVSIQRIEYGKGTLLQLRKDLLNDLGFVWDPLSNQWETGFGILKKFYQREGHSRVPHAHVEDGFKLGFWVATQRLARKSGRNSLSPYRIHRLDDLSFAWDPKQLDWEIGYKNLLTFIKRENHCEIPQSHIEDGFYLGRWVNRIRTSAKAGTLDKDKLRVLEQLNFTWVGSRKKR
jgi:superfamily II DNA or RNA helicase